ncbi:DUF1918 domain-containing protein [Yinghuangia aomiensis]
MILITGATAHFGRETAEVLAAAGERVRALSRTPEKAGLPEGVEVVRGDLTDGASLRPALAGVEAVFLVLPYGLDPSVLLKEAADAGVRRVVFLSSGAVVDGAAEQADVIAAYHARVEQAVVDAGFPWTFLRLMFPAINTLSFAMQLGGSDTVRAPYARAAASLVHERDVADAAAAVLTGSGHAGRTYRLDGPQFLTQAEQVRVLGDVLGRDLAFEELDDVPVREQMSAFMEPAFVNALFDLMAATVGNDAPSTTRSPGSPAAPPAATPSGSATTGPTSAEGAPAPPIRLPPIGGAGPAGRLRHRIPGNARACPRFGIRARRRGSRRPGKEQPVHATVGDRIHMHSNTVGQADRSGEIVEVRGTDGEPPYVVRFEDGHTSLVFPGPDSVVEPASAATARGGRSS